jgi:hypothetical protein
MTITRRYKEVTFGDLRRGELFRLAGNCLELYQKSADGLAQDFSRGVIQDFEKENEVIRVNADLEWWDA